MTAYSLKTITQKKAIEYENLYASFSLYLSIKLVLLIDITSYDTLNIDLCRPSQFDGLCVLL